MTAAILGNRFLASRDRPVWWDSPTKKAGRLGEGEQLTAIEGLQRIGEPVVTLEPLYAELSNLNPTYNRITLPERAIVRHPIAEDNEFRSFGVVGPDYSLITAGEAARLWDAKIGKFIETEFFMLEGRALVISCVLPRSAVKGEEVERFLVLANYTDGATASLAMVTTVCPVCQNTVLAGERLAAEHYRIVHDSTARDRMAQWLTGMYERATRGAAAVDEAMAVLAATRVTGAGAKTVLEAAYPYPSEPRRDAPAEVIRDREERASKLRETMDLRRLTALDLFQGAGTGMDLESRKGTMWGLVNAVVEVEDYRRGGSDLQAATSALLGSRAATKARAFDAALEFSRN